MNNTISDKYETGVVYAGAAGPTKDELQDHQPLRPGAHIGAADLQAWRVVLELQAAGLPRQVEPSAAVLHGMSLYR